MFSKVLIANRGEIACRIIRTAKSMGISTVAVYSDADENALHTCMADEGVHIGPAAVSESYLQGDKIIEAALQTGAEAIHPGYGFMSENPDFVKAVEAAGLVFIGPSASAIRKMGLKDAAKQLMERSGVPVVPGYHGENQDSAFLAEQADSIGYPVLIKARAGGGGKGMRIAESAESFEDALQAASREGLASFGDAHVLIEKYITSPRHIEVQVFGDNHGNVVHMYERDCSLQRRHQKIIEEAPAPGMTDALRAAMTDAAITAAKAINYSGAGTIEFIVDGSDGLHSDRFWFMEMNTRLQVEHPVTEAILGLDLVEWQLRVAAGEPLPKTQNQLQLQGHAFEARLYAEDPEREFLPATGKLDFLRFGEHARIDAGITAGDTITPHYDPMIAKIITHADTREQALGALHRALQDTHAVGTITNAGFLASLCAHEGFAKGQVDTGLIARDLVQLTTKPALPDAAIALASIAVLGLDIKNPMTGWRLWGQASHALKAAYAGDDFERIITLDGKQGLAMNGGTADIALSRISQNGVVVKATLDGRSISAEIVATNAYCSVLFEGITYVLQIPDPLASADTIAGDANAITAPMTGVIKIVDVVEGQAVKSGDRMVVMEAMKMELSLVAPRDGVVEAVLCEQNAPAADGAVLVRLIDDSASEQG